MSVVYRRFGGSTHVRVDTFAQLKEAVNVPETQWVATSAPLSSFAADATFLALLDSDHNDRIRVNELQAAVAWLSSVLSTDVGVDARSATLTLAHLAPTAEAIKRAAEAVLDVVAAADRATVTLDQVRAAEGPLRAAGRNGDGIVAAAQVPAAAQALASQIVSLFPEVKNRAGLAGVSPDNLAAFRAARASFLAHVDSKAAVFVWGDHSLARAQQVQAVTDVLDEHFLLCRLVASQPDARERFRLAADRIEGLVGNRAAMQAALAALPIAPPDPAGVLAFSTLHRGPHLEALQAFAADVLANTPGDKQLLTEATWSGLKATAASILAWQNAYETHQLAPIAASVAAIADADLDAIAVAQQKDLDDKVALDAIADLEKLLLLQRFLLAFANSFLAMPDLYTNHRALYERGHAILAGRRYELSLLVPDLGAHKAHTEQGTTCVVYGKVFDKDGGPGFDVVLPKTRGWSNELVVGKRGLFYDLDNKEHDLVVTHIVRQPVSVMEAALSPFLRIGEFLNKKLEGLNAGVDEAVDKHSAALGNTFDGTKAAAAAALTKAPLPAPAAPAAPAAPSTSAAGPAMGNALAMGGLAVAAVGSSVAFIAAQLKALSVADLLSIVVVGFAAIAGPSGFVGWLKLRRRNLAQLLEGAGWALNDRLRVTPALAARVTQTPSRVAGSSLEIVASPPVPGDPEESHTGWKIAAVVVLVLLAIWQVRGPLLRVGCHNGQVPAGVCLAAGVEISDTP